MRIAVVLPGFLREFQKTYKSLFLRILKDQRCDIFIPTWDILSGLCKCGRCKQQKPHGPLIKTSTVLDQVEAAYHPQQFSIFTHDERDRVVRPYALSAKLSSGDAGGFFGGNLIEFCSMLYLWDKAKEMIEEEEDKGNFQYDLIVKARTDIIFDSLLNLNAFPNPTLYLPNIFRYYGDNGVNDQIAWGGNEEMKTYLSFYHSVVKYIDEKAVSPPRPETLLRHHLRANGLPLNFIEMKYHIIRNDTVISPNPGGGHTENQSMSVIRHLL